MFYITFLVYLDSIRRLKVKTPNKETEIKIEGDNKRLTLMKKSIRYNKSKM